MGDQKGLTAGLSLVQLMSTHAAGSAAPRCKVFPREREESPLQPRKSEELPLQPRKSVRFLALIASVVEMLRRSTPIVNPTRRDG